MADQRRVRQLTVALVVSWLLFGYMALSVQVPVAQWASRAKVMELELRRREAELFAAQDHADRAEAELRKERAKVRGNLR